MWVFLWVTLLSMNSFASSDTGRAAASKYFTKDVRPLALDSAQIRQPAGSQVVDSGRRLGVFAGTFLQKSSQAEQGNSIGGWALRLDYQRESRPGTFLSKGYQLSLQKFKALGSELTNVTFFWSYRFPHEVVFPVYVGVAFGPGVFLRQLQDESWLSADIKGFLGFRLNGSSSQFYVEGGVQNQFLVLSSGQYQGWFVSSGVAYKF